VLVGEVLDVFRSIEHGLYAGPRLEMATLSPPLRR